MSFAYYENEVSAWGYDRKIIQHGKPMGQAVKTLEEAVELLDAVNKDDKDAIKDAIGDIVVTLIMQCCIQQTTVTECLALVYAQIKDRKGHLTPEGVFVKC